MDASVAKLRKLVKVITLSESLVSYGGLLLITALLCSYIPWPLMWQGPSTGGDTGSHYWPLITLLDYSLPHGTLRTWNPGNLGGEPHLVHYFPGGYLVMALLALFFDRSVAFNLGTILPFVLFPSAVFSCVRLSGLRFPAPIIATAFSLSALLNESYSMWGGNGLSLLAGQFAHAYSIVFLLFGIGFFVRAFAKGTFPLVGSILFSCVLISHAYVGIGLIIVYGVLWLYSPLDRVRFFRLLGSGVLTILLSAWFLIPMVTNAPWTTPFSIEWMFKDILKEVFPPIFYPNVFALIAGLFALFSKKVRRAYTGSPRTLQTLIIALTLGYASMYYLFPYIGLVDVRAIPQVLVAFTITAGISLALAIGKIRLFSSLITICVVAASVLYSDSVVKNFPHWCRWNYSGWKAKSTYTDLLALSLTLKGTFSDPRVVYEHNDANNKTGTVRVFEMLPYFASRSTLEGVYLQASILAPAAFLAQSLVSKTPSCPFREFPCARHDLSRALPILKELGVQDLILVTQALVDEMRRLPEALQFRGNFGQWTLASLKDPSLMVTVESAPLRSVFDENLPAKFYTLHNRPISPSNWKGVFFNWIFNYPSMTTRLIHPNYGSWSDVMAATASSSSGDVEQPDCSPMLDVDFGKLTLTTNCPDKLHVLKLAYHPTWITSDGRRPLLVSPGFMAITPHANKIELTFGQYWLWKLGDITSIASIIAVLVFAGMGIIRKRH
jgi:hypothetical protein